VSVAGCAAAGAWVSGAGCADAEASRATAPAGSVLVWALAGGVTSDRAATMPAQAASEVILCMGEISPKGAST
jgi:hypothetical protein